MTSPAHFIEAHYYAGGLRHQSYGTGSRPEWAPAEDSVGFQDEFQLDEGDAAVELRRFQFGDDRITWIGVYYRSIDSKLGDRQNHAGVGMWLRNGVVTDPAAFLHGLNTLAQFLAKNVDAQTLGPHVEKFLEPAFLPHYLKGLDDYPFAKGAPWAPLGMVDTRQFFVSCTAGVGDCRALSDYMLNLTLYGAGQTLQPRSLILVSRADQPPGNARSMTKIPVDFDAGSEITNNLPAMFETVTKRALSAEADSLQLNSRLAELQIQTDTLRAQQEDFVASRDDPVSVILRRLDELPSRWESGGGQRVVEPSQRSAVRFTRNHPVSPGPRPPFASESEPDMDWLKVLTFVMIVLLIGLLVYFIYSRWSDTAPGMG